MRHQGYILTFLNSENIWYILLSILAIDRYVLSIESYIGAAVFYFKVVLITSSLMLGDNYMASTYVINLRSTSIHVHMIAN